MSPMGTSNYCNLYDLFSWKNTKGTNILQNIRGPNPVPPIFVTFQIQALGYQTHWWHRFIADLERDLIEQVCHQGWYFLHQFRVAS